MRKRWRTVTSDNRKERWSSEAGFALIELLVVIIIMGILAAIAVPLIMNQRARAADAAIITDVKKIATGQESFYAGDDSYGNVADLTGEGVDILMSEGVTVTIVSYDNQGFCLKGENPGASTDFYYDSRAGGMQPRGTSACPVSSGGAGGGAFSG